MEDTTNARSLELVAILWRHLQLPEDALVALKLKETAAPFSTTHVPSSFHVDDLAQCTIGFFHLASAHYHALSTATALRRVNVSPLGASLEFKSESHFTIDGKPLPFPQSFGGLYATKDGHVRIHDGFEIHREGVRQILGLKNDAGTEEITRACLNRSALDLEEAAFSGQAVIGALRTFKEWDETPMGKAVSDFPIKIQALSHASEGAKRLTQSEYQQKTRCLEGIRVLELSRVIAAPVAGRALAAHGADVLWVTSSNLEDQPTIDRDTARGKRTIRLDLDNAADLQTLNILIAEADVFLQGYRPGSLARRGLGPEELQKLNPGIIYASMSAYPQEEINPWRENRGFDSIVQTCSGINVAEAESYNALGVAAAPAAARPLPCQALDHGSGFLLAAGIVTALCRRHETGRGQLVDVSLAGTSRYLRSLGQFDSGLGFGWKTNTKSIHQVIDRYGEDAGHLFETADSEFGKMRFVKPAGLVEGAHVGWDRMPRALGSDEARWL